MELKNNNIVIKIATLVVCFYSAHASELTKTAALLTTADIQELIADAEQKCETKNYETAFSILSQLENITQEPRLRARIKDLLADMYVHGKGVVRNHKRAYDLFGEIVTKLPHDELNIWAELNQCNLVLNSTTKEDFGPARAQALETLERLTKDQDHPVTRVRAHLLLGSNKSVRTQAASEHLKAFFHLQEAERLATNTTRSDVYCALGTLYFDTKFHAKAFECLQNVQDNSARYFEACYHLGILYFNGEVVDKDREKACELWKLVAGQTIDINHQVLAWTQLAHAYMNGCGTSEDQKLILSYIERAKDQTENSEAREIAVNLLRKYILGPVTPFNILPNALTDCFNATQELANAIKSIDTGSSAYKLKSDTSSSEQLVAAITVEAQNLKSMEDRKTTVHELIARKRDQLSTICTRLTDLATFCRENGMQVIHDQIIAEIKLFQKSDTQLFQLSSIFLLDSATTGRLHLNLLLCTTLLHNASIKENQ